MGGSGDVASATAADRTMARLCDPDRLQALSDAGLTARPDPEMQYYAERVCTVLGVPVAVVTLVQADRQVFPGMVGLPEPWATRRATPLTHSVCQHVVASGAPLVVRDARHVRLVRDSLAIPELGVVGYAGMPLTDSDGHVLGALAAIDTTARAWTDTELDALRGMARACSSELRLRLAVHDATRERARRDELDDLLRAALERSELLLSTAHAMTENLSTEDKLAALARCAVPALADWCSVFLLDRPVRAGVTPAEPLTALRVVVAPAGDLATGPAVGGRVGWPGDDALTLAVATGATTLVDLTAEEPPEWARTAGVARALREAGTHSAALVPVAVDGRVHAVLAFAATGGRAPYTAVDRPLFELIAAQAGVAQRQGDKYDHARDAAMTLQRALLTEPPPTPGLDVCVRYRPAVEGNAAGGDWYDVFTLRGGDVAVVVGDVVGHDIAAAAAMGQLRAILRGFGYHTDAAAPHVLESLDDVVQGMRLTRLATCIYSRFRAAGPGAAGPEAPGPEATVSWSNAGHPAPVLVHPTGEVSILDHPRDPALGVAAGLTRTAGETALPPGSTLLLFTDGLFERRGRDLDDTLTDLTRLAATWCDQPLGLLCDELMSSAPDDDDVAIVALRPT